VVGQQKADIADTLQLRDVAIVNIFWLSIANTTEPSMWGGDVALCQLALTACYYYQQYCAQGKAPVYKLLRGRFEIFCPTGATRCTNGGG